MDSGDIRLLLGGTFFRLVLRITDPTSTSARLGRGLGRRRHFLFLFSLRILDLSLSLSLLLFPHDFWPTRESITRRKGWIPHSIQRRRCVECRMIVDEI
jgi:hypothetical protein